MFIDLWVITYTCTKKNKMQSLALRNKHTREDTQTYKYTCINTCVCMFVFGETKRRNKIYVSTQFREKYMHTYMCI